MFAPSVYGRV